MIASDITDSGVIINMFLSKEKLNHANSIIGVPYQ